MIFNSLIAIFPCLLLVFLFIWLDKYEPESYFNLIASFVGGLMISFPAYYLEGRPVFIKLEDEPSIINTLILSFGVVGLIEEGLKYLVFLAYPWRKSFFNEPYDGILYAVLISLGFATAENVVYGYFHSWEIALFRGFTAVMAHVVFGIFMGYYFSKAKFDQKPFGLALALLVPIFIHGLYDFLILQSFYEPLALLAIFIIYFLLFRMRTWIKEYQERSPFKV